MSTAHLVPEGLVGGHPDWLRRHEPPVRALLADSLRRLRAADGFSHSRAMAFQTVLTIVPAWIAVIALTSLLRWGSLATMVTDVSDAVAPGATSDVFRDAVGQAKPAGRSAWTALALGGVAMTVGATTSFGQFERTANRVYGVEADRPTLVKYGRAFVCAVVTTATSTAVLAVGGLIEESARRHPGLPARLIRSAAWPVGALLGIGALVLVFAIVPRRRQPGPRWLVVGAVVAVLAMAIVSGALSVYLDASGSFGDTYGPLAGLMGVLLWTYGLALALFFGLAVAAQLEAALVGVPGPRDDAAVAAAAEAVGDDAAVDDAPVDGTEVGAER